MVEILTYAALGLFGLLVGGAVLIPGVVGLAQHLSLPAALVAVIVIAGGTSAPELLVSVDAALVGSPGIVWGNLVGSNIANILLVLGLGMLIHPVCADEQTRRQLLMMGGLTVLVWGICAAGGLNGIAGKLVSGGLVAGFVLWMIMLLRRPEGHAAQDGPSADDASLPFLQAAIYAGGGVVCLVAGADAFVWSGATLARSWGWSEAVVGMSLIAVGTSCPEIISVLASLRYKRGDIALGVRSGLVFVGFYLAFLGLQLGTHNA